MIVFVFTEALSEDEIEIGDFFLQDEAMHNKVEPNFKYLLYQYWVPT